MDLLNFVIAVDQELGVDIPESDYPLWEASAHSWRTCPSGSPFPSATGSRTPLRPCRDGGPPT